VVLLTVLVMLTVVRLSTIYARPNTGWCSRRVAPASFLCLHLLMGFLNSTSHVSHCNDEKIPTRFQMFVEFASHETRRTVRWDRPTTPNHIKRMFKPRRNFSMDPVMTTLQSSWTIVFNERARSSSSLDKTDASASTFIPRLDDTLNVTHYKLQQLTKQDIYCGSIPIK
jgi:hypothetical protein